MGLCDNRTIIITGAGGGLGRAYAIALGVAGGNVVVNDINPDTAAETGGKGFCSICGVPTP